VLPRNKVFYVVFDSVVKSKRILLQTRQ